MTKDCFKRKTMKDFSAFDLNCDFVTSDRNLKKLFTKTARRTLKQEFQKAKKNANYEGVF